MTYSIYAQPIEVYKEKVLVGKGYNLFMYEWQDIFIVDLNGNELPSGDYHLCPAGETMICTISEKVQ